MNTDEQTDTIHVLVEMEITYDPMIEGSREKVIGHALQDLPIELNTISTQYGHCRVKRTGKKLIAYMELPLATN